MGIPIVVRPRRVPRDFSGMCTIRLQFPNGSVWKTYESEAVAIAEAKHLGLIKPKVEEEDVSGSQVLNAQFAFVDEACLDMAVARSAGFR